MEELALFKENQLINMYITPGGNIVTKGRELHRFLKLKTRYDIWFGRMLTYDFKENRDYQTVVCEKTTLQGNKTEYKDHFVKIEMAKELCMLQRNNKGKQARRYFLEIDKAWNSPDMVMKRALELADKRVSSLKLQNEEFINILKEQQPKVAMFDIFLESKNTRTIKEIANLINAKKKKNKKPLGRNQLFQFLKNKKILTSYDMPYQQYIDRGYFIVVEVPSGEKSYTQTRVTPKGLEYIIKKLKEDEYIFD